MIDRWHVVFLSLTKRTVSSCYMCDQKTEICVSDHRQQSETEQRCNRLLLHRVTSCVCISVNCVAAKPRQLLSLIFMCSHHTAVNRYLCRPRFCQTILRSFNNYWSAILSLSLYLPDLQVVHCLQRLLWKWNLGTPVEMHCILKSLVWVCVWKNNLTGALGFLWYN